MKLSLVKHLPGLSLTLEFLDLPPIFSRKSYKMALPLADGSLAAGLGFI